MICALRVDAMSEIVAYKLSKLAVLVVLAFVWGIYRGINDRRR